MKSTEGIVFVSCHMFHATQCDAPHVYCRKGSTFYPFTTCSQLATSSVDYVSLPSISRHKNYVKEPHKRGVVMSSSHDDDKSQAVTSAHYIEKQYAKFGVKGGETRTKSFIF